MIFTHETLNLQWPTYLLTLTWSHRRRMRRRCSTTYTAFIV